MTSRPPLLLTPGPLTTAPSVRAALDRDWGSRDRDFIAVTARVRTKLCALLPEHDGLTAIPIQGSGSFAVEAMLGTFVPPGGHVLVLVNGAYGRRMAEMAARAGRRVSMLEGPETEAPDVAALVRRLAQDPTIRHVAVVHCETTTGLLTPLADVSDVAARHGCGLLIDAMSSFGALPIPASVRFEALASSANKCLQGVPGLAFVLARTEAVARAGGQAHALVLDLAAQWAGFEANGQWRFTPPTQCVAALDRALADLDAEGGPPARLARYQANLAALTDGLAAHGFHPLVAPALQAPIIVTFPAPDAVWWDFAALYDGLLEEGFAIYPGKTAAAESFRVGCIGAVAPPDFVRFGAAFGRVVAQLSQAAPRA
ncbi:2-aminoethylphosphonate--pyruvate transaminase [Aquabacter spiritensis]|uniref:2-aminoethylphosphonate--pyruvate transaminase n=1 Tax=Aquabacter spiritensis TaxID=933073 RepID=A0A4R3LXQ4_9HYPH|nr:2-aminoethylphosphonate--pyruvate transaminase [Aquabacter spiritensis]TCT03525.1 2-aminoethylphosphonate--pyruvate transaminase [Aquabacter spiritensis]